MSVFFFFLNHFDLIVIGLTSYLLALCSRNIIKFIFSKLKHGLQASNLG